MGSRTHAVVAAALAAVFCVPTAAQSTVAAGPSAKPPGRPSAPLVAATRTYFHHLDKHWLKRAHVPPGLPLTDAARKQFVERAGVVDQWRTIYAQRDIDAVRYRDQVKLTSRPVFSDDRRAARARFQVQRGKLLDHPSYDNPRRFGTTETYVVRFVRSQSGPGLGRWLIASVAPPAVARDDAGADAPAVPAPGEPSASELPDTFTPPNKAGVSLRRDGTLRTATGASPLVDGLDYQAMADYAKYWSGQDELWTLCCGTILVDRYNDEEYPRQGNNCMNFVSQALFAGGWDEVETNPLNVEDDSKWDGHVDPWIVDLYRTTLSWRASSHWQKFATNAGRVHRLDSIWNVALGDVLLADWDPNNTPDGTVDHAMIVTGWDSVMGPYISQNTPHRHNIPLTESLEHAAEQGKTDIVWYAYRT